AAKIQRINGMLSERQISQFERDGFVLGRRILNKPQIEILKSELRRVIEQRDGSRPQPVLLRNLGESDSSPVWQIVNIYQASLAFLELIANKTIAREIAQLTDARQLRIFHDQIQYKPSGRGGVNMWHQDAPYWPIISGGAQA